MASKKEIAIFLADAIEGLTFRPMMGEYILYFNSKVVGGIYDDRLLVKPTRSAKELLLNAKLTLPYEGAKPMLYVENSTDADELRQLFSKISQEV